MAKDTSGVESHPKRQGLLKDQVRSTKRKDSDRFEIVSIQNPLSFEKGFFVVIRACQLLAQKNDGIILVGIAGPSGAGKTIFTEKILSFMPSVAVISMDNYNDSSRIVDGNFDDPRLTDYDTLLKNVHDLKAGKPVEVPIYDFKSSTRTGYRTLEVPSSRIVIIEGIYALSANLRPLLDLRVSVTGGVHFDLVKRVLRDIQRAGQEPEEIIQQISETVYPMYKAFIEPDLQTAHIKIINKFNPFSGFQSPTYILKSARKVTVDQIKAVLFKDQKETTEQIYDIYLLPPGEDPETCQSYLRMRNKDGKYNLMFEEWVADAPFIISPRITFEVTVKLLSGLMALGYTIATILQRSSHIFSDDRVCVKIDWLGQLNRQYVQVQGRDRLVVKFIAEQLGLEGSYTPRTYIEQIQLERLVNEVMALPDDLKTKLSLDEDLVSSPKEALLRASADRVARRLKNGKSGMSHSYSSQRDKNLSKLAATSTRFDDRNLESPAALANQGAITQLSEQISSLNDRMDEFTTCIEELNSKLTVKKNSPSQQNMALPAEVCNGSAPTSYFVSGLGNGSLTGSRMPNSSSSSQLAKESPLMEELSGISRVQRQVMLRLDTLSNLVRDSLGERSQEVRKKRNRLIARDGQAPLIAALAVGCVGLCWFVRARNGD
ncbi:phosphoribulokinase/uridine kinase family protein [Salix suchowensis]|uniref:URIDINE KINASE n=4 Tax=Salix TaxID=40685 RepID=A0A9Q0WRK0_9ROSI|nr:phosphoribulokinase/uridine kinase family protein [Salix suchowensis]KAJ6772096.1 URIDINE KINASE [Salix koriyanagi]